MAISHVVRSGVCVGFLAAAGLVQAADLPSASAPPSLSPAPVFTSWEFSVSGYIWASALKGTLATVPPLPPVDIDMTIGDVFSNLGGALMGAFDAKYGRFILFNDLMYTRLLPDVSRAKGPLAVAVDVDAYSLIGLAAGGYRVVDGQQFTLDLLAGVRGFYMDNTITVRATLGPFVRGQRFANTQTWVDAVAGMRMRYQFDDRWFVNMIAFAGGGGSKYQWDVYSGAGYAFNRNWTAFAGYRAFKVDYRNGGFVYDVLQYGPLAGIQYRW